MSNQHNPLAIRNEIRTGLAVRKDQLAMLAKASGIEPERVIQQAIMAVSQSEYLQKCAPASIILSTMRAVELGLDLSPAMAMAYLVPFKGQAGLIVGFRGWIELAGRSGLFRSVEPRIVYKGDVFTIEHGPTGTTFRHVPAIEDRGDTMRAVYAQVTYRDGGSRVHLMTKAEIDRIRAFSPAGKSGPWSQWYEAMAMSKCVKAAMKYERATPLVARAMEIDADKPEFTDTPKRSALADALGEDAQPAEQEMNEGSEMDAMEGEVIDPPPSRPGNGNVRSTKPEPIDPKEIPF